MKFESLTPNIAVKNVNKTVDYYKQHFGFQLVISVPETGDLAWAMVQRDDVMLMFQEESSLNGDLPMLKERTIGGNQTFYMRVKGVQDLYNDLKGKVNIVSDLATTFYGTIEFTVEDINGYLLTFSERQE